MGQTKKQLVPFTEDHVLDKSLMIDLLKKEEILWFGPWGQDVHKNKYNYNRVSLIPQIIIQKRNLVDNGFDPSDESIKNYRSTFRTYWNSPTDYDKDILNAVHYFRNNRILYYTSPILYVGDNVRNIIDTIQVQDLEGDKVSLKHALSGDWDKCLLHAFSMS